jgi:hypothetical protein
VRKNLGGCSGCDADRVLDLIAGQAELLGDRIDGLSCAEQIDARIRAGCGRREEPSRGVVVERP